ncbi:MAG: hypothetical protein GY791_02070 [Alphaproteobacteria bacterium]|nr:hypothetical protein [Alphaproteobacteria bacterium]
MPSKPGQAAAMRPNPRKVIGILLVVLVAGWLAACAAAPEKAGEGETEPPKWGPWVEFGTGVRL